ncbi:hypothetical protein [Runella salmonicolor]|uniref:Lipocalin-like domain-containing protein n=1 Tax=Runella salmonicolor TaxID=2950278 RepID=A0ABT1FW82_9BACT|nr:hypothetical protein [Runella salmonicolor]MCP1386018.1 hypothetical protein [Runella salmonicolor]
MKTYFYLLVLLVTGISCKPDYVTVGKKLEGTWQLNRIQYVNPNDKLIVINNPAVVMTFTDSKRNGVLTIDSSKYNFEYNFGPEKCNIDVKNEKSLPLEAIGKVQVYSYQFMDKKTIKFSIDKEYNYTTEEVLKNVEYIFVKQ